MRDPHPLPGSDHVLRSTDGSPLRLHLVRHGRAGDRPPLLLLHGFPTSSYLWRDVVRDLEHDVECLVPDLVGLGHSERPHALADYRLDTQARLVAELLDQCGVEQVHVVGHDIGGGVAVHLAAEQPARVASLTLVDAPLHADEWPPLSMQALGLPVIGGAQARGLGLVPAVGRRYLGLQLRRGLRSTSLSRARLHHYASPLLTAEGARGLVQLVRALDPAALEAALRVVAVAPPPTLVLWADGDAWHDVGYGERVAASIPGACFVPITGAGHFLPEDRPERVAEEIIGFLAELQAEALMDAEAAPVA